MVSSFSRRLVVLAALALSLLSVVPGSVTAAHAEGSGDSISWTVRTALSKYGSDRAKFAYTVQRGERLTDGIDIANTGAKAITLKIYAADGFTTESGGFDILTPDKPSTGIGLWVKPAAPSITIPAGKQVQIPFTLQVPASATPGDHMGGIVTVLDQQGPADGRTVIHQRVGLRLTTRVSGKLAPRLAVEDVKVRFPGSNPFGKGPATVSYTVHNTGNTVLGGLQKVEVAGGFGLSSRSVDVARLPSLLPGETRHVKVTVDDVRALLVVSASVKVTPVLTDAAGSTSTLAPVTGTARSVVSIWSFVVLVGFVVALAGLVRLIVFAVKRRRRAIETKVEAKVAAALEDALKEKAGT